MLKRPKSDFNVCEDFFKIIITSYIISAAMSMLEMESIHDTPSAEALNEDPGCLWLKNESDCSVFLTELCKRFLNKYVDFKYHDSETCFVQEDRVLCYTTQLLSILDSFISNILMLSRKEMAKGCSDVGVISFQFFLDLNRRITQLKHSCYSSRHDFFLSPRLAKSLIWSIGSSTLREFQVGTFPWTYTWNI